MTHTARRAAPWVTAWVVASAVFALLDLATANYRDFDFIGMWLAARGTLSGADIYDAPTWLRLFVDMGSEGYALLRGTGFGYSFPTAIVFMPFGLVPFRVAAAAWLAAELVLVISGVCALGRALFTRNPRRDLVLLLGLCAATQPMWVSTFTGQVGPALTGVVAHATALMARDRFCAAGAMIGWGIVKPHLFVWSIPMLVARSPRRVPLMVGMLLTGGTVLAISFAVRPDWPVAWLHSAVGLQDLNVSRANAFGIAPANARWLGWVAVALVGTALLVWWRSRPPVIAFWSAALAFSLFAAPYSWSYDQGLLTIGAAVVIAAVSGAPAARRGAALAALALAWVVLPWALYLETHRTGAEPFAGIVPVLVITLVIATRSRMRTGGPDA